MAEAVKHSPAYPARTCELSDLVKENEIEVITHEGHIKVQGASDELIFLSEGTSILGILLSSYTGMKFTEEILPSANAILVGSNQYIPLSQRKIEERYPPSIVSAHCQLTSDSDIANQLMAEYDVYYLYSIPRENICSIIKH